MKLAVEMPSWGNFPNLNNKFVIEDAQKCKIIRVLRKKKKADEMARTY